MAGEVMALHLACREKYLLGPLDSYRCLVLENTGGDSYRYSLVFLPPSSTLAGSSRRVLPQGDFSRSSLVCVQPTIAELNSCRPFRYTVNRLVGSLAHLEPTNTLAYTVWALLPQADRPLHQHHNLWLFVVVACQRRQSETEERANR